MKVVLSITLPLIKLTKYKTKYLYQLTITCPLLLKDMVTFMYVLSEYFGNPSTLHDKHHVIYD